MKVFADLGQVNKTDQLKSMDTEKKKKKNRLIIAVNMFHSGNATNCIPPPHPRVYAFPFDPSCPYASYQALESVPAPCDSKH
jgi:hypothetical protein